MKRLVAVVGPTGSGKSDLGIRIARELEGEIVGCDALQIYQQLNIGTAKVPPGERGGIAHHLVDQVGSAPNVAAWQSGRRLVKE